MNELTWQDVADRLEGLKASDCVTLRLLARLPLIHASALARVRGWVGDQAAYDSLARLHHSGFARGVRLPVSSTASPQRHYLTDLGIAAVALDRQADATDLAQVLGLGARGLTSAIPHARLLHATYELFGLVAMAAGAEAELRCWQRPWSGWYRAPNGICRHVVLPALAGMAWGDCESEYFLLPDITNFSLRVYRSTIRALYQVRARCAGSFPRLIVATGGSARAARWHELVTDIAERRGDSPLGLIVGAWDELPGLLRVVVGDEACPVERGIGVRPRVHALKEPDRDRAIPKLVGGWPVSCAQARHSSEPTTAGAMRTPSDLELLTLIGQHPFLKVVDIAVLLGWQRGRTAYRCSRLIRDGLARELGPDEIGPRSADMHMELTRAGLDAVAAWHGLYSRSALIQARVLVGGGPGSRNRARKSLLRTFEHTQGVYKFFVDLSVAAMGFRELGWDNELVEWQSIPAAKRPRPDAYGAYRHQGRLYGFVLEYDRGTEKGQHYLRKFGAYFTYVENRRFERDYDGIPTILMVAPDETAECRIAGAACAAARGRVCALPLLLTYQARIQDDRHGLLGSVWREPHAGFDDRRLWPLPPGGATR